MLGEQSQENLGIPNILHGLLWGKLLFYPFVPVLDNAAKLAGGYVDGFYG